MNSTESLAMLRHYPKSHIFTIIAVTVFMGMVLLVTPSEQVEANKSTSLNTEAEAIVTADLELDGILEYQADEPAATAVAALPKNAESEAELAVAEPSWQSLSVKNGDNLTTLFKRAGLTARDVYEVSQAAKKDSDTGLHRLYPGQELAVIVENNALKRLKYLKNPLETIEFVRNGSGFDIEKLVFEPEIRTRFVAATLEDSLFMSGQRAGIPHGVIMELAHVFGGVIDFIFDPRKGDTFSLVFEEKFLNGERIGTGNVLAAEFVNAGEQHVALRYVDTHGDAGYYSPEGVSMHKAFLRAPLDFTRVSSNFNLNRKHPIHKKIMAHRGIDYAAPTGTPVYAAGDGKVIESGFSRPNGNYVFIRHGERYVTKYLHLHKRNVKTGQRVKQRQVIGTVGSTGYATGPHLHYEFLIDGVHQNPRNIADKLPRAMAIAQNELPRFKASTQPLLAQLNAAQRLLASNQ